MKKSLVFLTVSIVFASCYTTPQQTAWTPLKIESGVPGNIDLEEPISISFETTGPWTGENRLPLDGEIKTRITELLSRRGFDITDDDSTNRIDISVAVEREERRVIVSYSNGIPMTASRVVFVYDMRIDGYVGDEVVWNWYSTWISRTGNPKATISSAVAQAFSNLDSSGSIIPSVPELKESHVENYYQAYVKDEEFSCPALPSVIRASGVSSTTGTATFLAKLSPPTALPAYVDLLQTAEFAVPYGFSLPSSPISSGNWKSVELGGTYLLGPDEEQIRVIIRLTGMSDYYFISEAKVANDEEWTEFVERWEEWQAKIDEFFDMYVE
ncbi:MAG: hypothetical protein PF508_16845 [Spirochaeta sp.]|jgi:hypothetical protein|nr:hypothetical protein [Spirochaeta sp.]